MPAENENGCCYTLEVKPFSVMTCTTMSVDDVNGTDSVKKSESSDKVLSLPYTDNFNYGEDVLRERGRKPFYAVESSGEFEIISIDGGNALIW